MPLSKRRLPELRRTSLPGIRFVRNALLANSPRTRYSHLMHQEPTRPIRQNSRDRYPASANNLAKRSPALNVVFTTAIIYFIWLMTAAVAKTEDRDMVLEGLDGDVTTNEYRSFIDKLNFLPPPPTNNIDNSMVDERDGARLHGMQTFYAFTHDRRDLDMAIVWSDAFLHARNDPTNGRITWTGQRDLCWPNKDPNDKVWAGHSSSENGDVIEHIVNTARLILENSAVWNQTAPPDKFGFGATYLERAKTYVRECQRSADTTIVPWFVRSTKDGYRLYYPDSAAFFKATDGNESGPIPWNHQQEIVGALLRLAQCHRLLNDGNTNIAYYEKITADVATWFFANAVPLSAKNHVCYLWSYGLPRDPVDRPEVTYESDYDMFIFRAYQANLGPTRQQMQRLINTGRYLMYLGTNRVSGYINGTSDNNSSRHERHYFEFEWIEMSVLDHDFYRLTAGNILAIHEYWDNLAIEAAVLSAKHYWATHSPMPEPQEVLDPAKLPAVNNQISPLMALILRHTPHSLISAGRTPAAMLGTFWGISELFLAFTRRAKSNAVSKDRRSTGLIWLVNLAAVALGVVAAYRIHAWRMPRPDVSLHMGLCVFVMGLVLRWYSIIYLGRFFTVNVAIAPDHRVIDSGPYRFIRHPSYTGALLVVLGFSLCLQNWASLLIVFVPICAVILRRIRIEEQALANALGPAYENYMRRTKRLIPFIY